MKVLYISHHRERTGSGQSAIDYILALDAAGVDVVPRAVFLGVPKETSELPPRIVELEKQSTEGAEVCIQHVLPHLMDYNGHMKNIGLYFTETHGITSTGWPAKLNTMDELWVPTTEMWEYRVEDNIHTPMHVVPIPSDVSKFQKEYDVVASLDSPNNYLFYFIGEWSKRKHVTALMKAFYSEFGINEPVELVIKTHKNGMSGEDCKNMVLEHAKKVKFGLGLYPDESYYKGEHVITSYLTEKQIMSLHQTCDCLVAPSYGEAWNIPAFEATGMGNMTVCSNVGGMKNFSRGYLVNGDYEQVFGADRQWPSIGTARESWYNISIKDLAEKMRLAYQQGKQDCEEGREVVYLYSYEAVGEQMRCLLEE